MNIRTTVIDIIAEEIGAKHDAITDDASLMQDLGADSPHLYEMALAIEEQFGFEIPDKDLARLHTVGQVIAYVQRKKGL